MAILITGVAGFIGCNLASVMLEKGEIVFGIDNFCLGHRDNILNLKNNARFQFIEVDMGSLDEYTKAIKNLHSIQDIREVWHLAANSDIQAGVNNAEVDLKNTFMTTFNTLAIMKMFNIPVIAFASSSAIYGDHGNQTLFESTGPLLPISNYGAMKLASEAIISASTESHLKQAFIFRFPNVIGVPATHGVILDFVRKLKTTPNKLEVMGNGTQKKSYLHVDELIDAMLFIRKKAIEKIAIYNIGPSDLGVTVRFIAEEVIRHISPNAAIYYGEDNKGWLGDVPRFSYCIDKLMNLGWAPKIGSKDAIRMAIQQIALQEAGRS